MSKNKFGCFDIETDPFKSNRIPRAFCADFFNGERHTTVWGADCVNKLLPAMLRFNGDIYAHNGGKFDFHYLLPELPDSISLMLINSRIARISVGKTRFKDSYLILPIALKTGGEKKEIDYEKFEENNREIHKAEIISYMRGDNIALYNLVDSFRNEFGMGLTLAGRALNYMKCKGYRIPRSTESFDDKFRPFYYGGRVQCFKSGTIEGNIKLYDINSAYPAAMKNCKHIFSTNILTTKKLPKNDEKIKDCFIEFTGDSSGCLPVRDKSGVGFPLQDRERFFATGHEVAAGLDTNTIRIRKIHRCYHPQDTISFADYIDDCFNKRQLAKKAGNHNKALLYKLVMNSSYGKFALNPRKFTDDLLLPTGDDPPQGEGWAFVSHCNDSGFSLWSRPTIQRGPKYFYNVATAASITGAVRAFLWKSLHSVENPLYCDTDSIMFTGKHKLKISDKLGDWSLEAEGKRVHIAGKKLYAFERNDGTYKTASKGVKIKPGEIISVSNGAKIKWENYAPTFSIKNETKFIHRNIQKTA